MKHPFPKPKYRLSLPLSLLAAVLLAGGITLLALWCQPNSFRGLLSGFLRQPLLIVLNALPVGLLLLGAAALFRNVFFGAALVNLAVCALSVANRVKIEVRDEPVFPRDFALLKEVGSALESYDIRYPVPQIAAVVLATAALLALGFFIGCKPFPVEKLRGWAGSLLGFAASLAVLAGLIFTVYASKDLYQSFKVSNAEYVPAVFNDLGFPYAFCHHFTTYLVDRPEGFRRAEAEAWETGDAPGQGKNVSVVMVMNEAFSDITDAPAFRYPEEDDPLRNLHALREDSHALSGHVAVPGFAGGTANTEFDVLTGMQTTALSASATSAMRVVNRDLDSLFRVFGNDGYETSFYHPGDNWFYNRENVYRWFGAEETRFIGDMEDPEYKGRWVTDDYAAGLIEKAFEEAEAPLFHFTTTIQNHMSYTADKYGPDYAFPPTGVSGLSEEAETLLSVYVEGVRDADAMLGRLWKYFDAQSEPVVLVYWGDHLPYLGNDMLAYKELGIDVAPGPNGRENLTAYQTPFVIWANEAAAEALDWENAAEALDLKETVSACFLGAAILELTGRGEESPWFSFLNELRRELPVVQKNTCQLADGSVTDTLTAKQQELVQKWRRWSYYKLQYKEVP
ncbi:LTA synthase family protein [Oscillibacter sp.]|uniref:LTA synthase family protein n=1 Tax=Oscillibacter sp. TaxID=1945593 RepID=UPI002D7F36D8|nr:LTA synthase family protein [Oscillibacter sp.]